MQKIKYLQSQLFINGCHCTKLVSINHDLFSMAIRVVEFSNSMFYNICISKNFNPQIFEHPRILRPRALFYIRGVVPGGAGVHPQIWADQLTLSQPGGTETRGDMPMKIMLAPPDFQTFRRPCIEQTAPAYPNLVAGFYEQDTVMGFFGAIHQINTLTSATSEVRWKISNFIVDFDVEKREDFGVLLSESINFDYLRP